MNAQDFGNPTRIDQKVIVNYLKEGYTFGQIAAKIVEAGYGIDWARNAISDAQNAMYDAAIGSDWK